MDLLDNPFYILGMTPRDNIHRIMELAEERSLFLDPDKCRDARDMLTHPRNRISAEVAWMLGVLPERTNEMLILLESSAGNYHCRDKSTSTTRIDSLAAALSRLPYSKSYNVADHLLELLSLSEGHLIIERTLRSRIHSNESDNLMEIKEFLGIENLTPIARANLLAARMLRLPDYTPDDVTKWIIAIAKAFEEINPEDVLLTLNEERSMSDFPLITDPSTIAIEIQNRRHYYQQVIKSVLNNIHSAKERLNAVIMVVDGSPTDYGRNRKALLIEDTVDAYKVKAVPVLEMEEKNIETQDQKLRYAADTKVCHSTFAPMVDKLIQAVKNWHIMAQPIILKKERMGFHNSDSYRVAMDVRRLAIYLFNEHDILYISLQILNMLKEVFAGMSEIVERITTDLETLNKIAEQRKQKKS